MSKTDTQPDHPLRETEQAAYHAYREWPVLLVLRLKELAAHAATPNKADAVLSNSDSPLAAQGKEPHAKP